MIKQKKKAKKTTLVVGGVILSVVVCGVAYVFTKNGLSPLTKAKNVIKQSAESAVTLPHKPAMSLGKCSKESPTPVPKTTILRGPLDKDVLETCNIDIAAHKSRLPLGKHASETAKELAHRLNVDLGPDETMVRDYSRGQWRQHKSA